MIKIEIKALKVLTVLLLTVPQNITIYNLFYYRWEFVLWYFKVKDKVGNKRSVEDRNEANGKCSIYF